MPRAGFCCQKGPELTAESTFLPQVLEPDEKALANLVPHSTSLVSQVLKQPDGRQAAVAMADLKAQLEEWLEVHPDDYWALVELGELHLRVGFPKPAQELLFKATLQRPPSWEAYQRTSYLLRRAEEQLQKSFDRGEGSAPPAFVLNVAAGVGRAATSALRKIRGARSTQTWT